MQRRIHQPAHGECHVLAGEQRAIGEAQHRAAIENQSPAVFRDLPFGGEFALQLLGVAIQPDQHTARQITNRGESFILDQQGIECFRVVRRQKRSSLDALNASVTLNKNTTKARIDIKTFLDKAAAANN